MIKGGHLDTWCPSPSHWSLIRSASLISSISDHTNSNVKTKGKGCFYLMTENEPLTLHLWAEATMITALILGVTDCPDDWSLQTAVVHQPLFVWLTLCGFIMMSTPVNSWGMRALTKPLYVNSWAPVASELCCHIQTDSCCLSWQGLFIYSLWRRHPAQVSQVVISTCEVKCTCSPCPCVCIS